jgi:hypothetical protein
MSKSGHNKKTYMEYVFSVPITVRFWLSCTLIVSKEIRLAPVSVNVNSQMNGRILCAQQMNSVIAQPMVSSCTGAEAILVFVPCFVVKRERRICAPKN